MNESRGRYRSDVAKERFADPASSEAALAAYAQRGQFEVIEVQPGSPSEARVAHYPKISLGHVFTPPMRMQWRRSTSSVTRGFAVVVLNGRMRLDIDDGCVIREGQVAVIGAGTSTVGLSMTAPANEFVFISASLDALPAEVVDLREPVHAAPLNLAPLEPTLSFIRTLCATPAPMEGETEWLATTAFAMAQSTIGMLVDGVALPVSLYERALRHIRRHHADPDLTATALAVRLGVGMRTLGGAFRSAGTTPARELRRARVDSFRAHRRTYPERTVAELAAMAGFTSVSAMQRAARAGDQV